jgi:hypothetical protein
MGDWGGRHTSASTAQRGVALKDPEARDANLPRLEFSTTKLDLGDGKPNEILRGELTIINRGTEAAKFSLVKHCGCTELSPLAGQLAPGASETIHVGLQLADRANSEKNTSIDVRTGEPATIVGRVVVNARCPAPFSVTPAFVSFGSLAQEYLSGASRELRLHAVDGQPAPNAAALQFELSDCAFDVQSVPTERGGTTAGYVALRVRPKRALCVGDHWDTLDIRVPRSEYSVRVPLNVSVTEPITVVPGTISLRSRANKTGVQRLHLLVIDRRHNSTLGRVVLVDGPQGVDVEDLGDSAPNRRRVRLTIAAPTESWPDDSEVRLGADGATFAFTLRKSS